MSDQADRCATTVRIYNVRGPRKDGSGRFYWRADGHDPAIGKRRTVWTGWAHEHEVFQTLEALGYVVLRRNEKNNGPAAAQIFGFVYFIQSGAGPIKIGFTVGDPIDRMKTLQTGSPKTLRLLAAIKATPQMERFLHKALRRHRLRGEWFRAVGVLPLISDGPTP